METDPELEAENGPRRISKPRVQYSPPAVGVSSSSTTTKYGLNSKKQRLPVKIPTPKSVSPSFTSEMSLFDDDFDSDSLSSNDYDSDYGVDEISQTDLREQLSQLPQQDFKLPGYFDIPNRSTDHCSPLITTGFGAMYFDSSLDEQEEIKVLESPLTDVGGGEIDNTASPAHASVDAMDNTPKKQLAILSSDGKLVQKMQQASPKQKQPTKPLIHPSPIVRSKLGVVQSDESHLSADTQKRPRRPPKKSDDFVYAPLVKMLPPIKPIKSAARINLLKQSSKEMRDEQNNKIEQNQSDLCEISEAEQSSSRKSLSVPKEPTDEMNQLESAKSSPAKIKTVGRKRKQQKSPVSVPQSSSSEPKIKRRPLKMAKILPQKPITVELAQSITKRLRRPAMRSDDFLYIPVKKDAPNSAKPAKKDVSSSAEPAKKDLSNSEQAEPSSSITSVPHTASTSSMDVTITSTKTASSVTLDSEGHPIKRKRGRPRRVVVEGGETSQMATPKTPKLKTTPAGQESEGPKRKIGESPISGQNLTSSPRPRRRIMIAARMRDALSARKSIGSHPKMSVASVTRPKMSPPKVRKEIGITHPKVRKEFVKKADGAKQQHPMSKEERKKRSERQLRKLEFIKRMTQMRHLNPLAIGLKRRAGQNDIDYFYREILVSQTDRTATRMNEDIEVDCVGVIAPGGFEELFVTNPAESCANSVNKFLSKNGALLPISEQDEADVDVDLIISQRIQSADPEVQEYLTIIIKFIYDQRLVDSITQGIAGGISMFYSQTMKNANRLRESLRLYSKSYKPIMVAVHSWFLKNLSCSLLISYLNLLRFLKNAGSSLGDYVVQACEETKLKEANHYIGEFLGQKLYEPPLSPTSKFIDVEPIRNVSLVLVYPQINIQNSNKHIIHAHEILFRNLLPLAVCCVEKVELNLDVPNRPISVEECTWMCIRLIRRRVREIARRRPNDHIFLAGWGTTCWLNHKVISKTNGVSGLLDFAFPTESACGSRGSVDDQICLTYPSTLFVVGEDAQNVKMKALQRMRNNMIADTGLIVIGNANHNLFVSPTVLSIERTSQFVVHRHIVEYTMQFIKQVVTDLGPPKECRMILKPIKLPSVHEIDPGFFKATGGTTGRPRKHTNPKMDVDESHSKKGEATSKVGDTIRKASSTLRHPTLIAGHLPPQLRPSVPTASSKYGIALHSARSSFSSSLKNAAELREKATTSSSADVLKIPSPEALKRQIPPLHRMAPPTTSAQSHSLQDTLQEEEEAAAALASLK